MKYIVSFLMLLCLTTGSEAFAGRTFEECMAVDENNQLMLQFPNEIDKCGGFEIKSYDPFKGTAQFTYKGKTIKVRHDVPFMVAGRSYKWLVDGENFEHTRGGIYSPATKEEAEIQLKINKKREQEWDAANGKAAKGRKN